MSASTLVAVGRGWTPEEAARHEVALYSALASDKQALRVYLQKMRVVETVRAGRQQHVASLPEGNAKRPGPALDRSRQALVRVAWAAARRRHGAPCAAAKVKGAAAQER